MECLETRIRATALLDWHIEVEGDDEDLKPYTHLLTLILTQIPRLCQDREVLLHAI